MTEVIMPKMGDGMEEGTLVEWLKKDGEAVKSGEVIGTIQTDKATLELEAPSSGTLTGFLISPGDTVAIGKPIAALLKAGESLPASWGSGKALPESSAPVDAKPEVDSPTDETKPETVGDEVDLEEIEEDADDDEEDDDTLIENVDEDDDVGDIIDKDDIDKE